MVVAAVVLPPVAAEEQVAATAVRATALAIQEVLSMADPVELLITAAGLTEVVAAEVLEGMLTVEEAPVAAEL